MSLQLLETQVQSLVIRSYYGQGRLRPKGCKIISEQLKVNKELDAICSEKQKGQNYKPKLSQTMAYKYSGSSCPPQWYPAYEKICRECGKWKHFQTVCRSKTKRAAHDIEHEYKIEQYTNEDGMVNIEFLIHNHKSQDIMAKLKISSY